MFRKNSSKHLYLNGNVRDGLRTSCICDFTGELGNAMAFLVGLNKFNKFFLIEVSFLGLKYGFCGDNGFVGL